MTSQFDWPAEVMDFLGLVDRPDQEIKNYPDLYLVGLAWLAQVEPPFRPILSGSARFSGRLFCATFILFSGLGIFQGMNEKIGN